jgi:hypothetical protein
MPEKYALDVYPLVDQLIRELKNGNGSGAMAQLLRRKLESFSGKVTTRTGSSPAVMIRWVSLTKVAA